MSSREAMQLLRRAIRSQSHSSSLQSPRRWTSTWSEGLEENSSLRSVTAAATSEFDPLKRAAARKTRLPAGRYQYRPPKYDRGPLHPIQPPPSSDPNSREFAPGPFSLSRIEQTYTSTIAPDILAMTYTHYPPGLLPAAKTNRLRHWLGTSSPYLLNRPPKGPPGGRALRPLRHPITPTTIPRVQRVLVHAHVSRANEDSAHLHVAGAVLQAITNRRVSPHKSKMSVMQWGARQGKFSALTATLTGEDMFDFVGRVVDIVMPRIREWQGVSGASGDETGNITFGLSPAAVASFPEIEVNIDSYPPKLIPGCHVTIHTSATNDRDARVLCTAMGIPFYGELSD